MRYFILVINVFYKLAWEIPVHSIDAKAITAAFKQVLLTANPRYPYRLQNDNGKEFFNLDFHALINTPQYPAFCQCKRLKGSRGR